MSKSAGYIISPISSVNLKGSDWKLVMEYGAVVGPTLYYALYPKLIASEGYMNWIIFNTVIYL